MPDKELVEVFKTTDNLIALQVIAEELKNSDIPCMVKGESAGDIYGIIVDGLAEKKIFVSSEHAVKAKGIIEEVTKTIE